MATSNPHRNPSTNLAPPNPFDSTPPFSNSTSNSTTSTSSTSFASPFTITPTHHHPDKVLNELSTSHAAPRTSTSVVWLGPHRLDTFSGDLSSSGTFPPSLVTFAVSSDIFEKQTSALSSPSRKTEISAVAREQEMPSSTRIKDADSVLLEEAVLINVEEENDDGWDFKCIGLEHDPACPKEGMGGG
ncbi:hypothetical protein BDD12DRAFT_878238 [Trichophaea hybrida]|nr:hypothetical protein BDD12DRAFT_878238 [Trichophaea hybrida]